MMNFSRYLGPSSRFGKTALVTGVPFGALMGLFWIFWLSSMPPLFGVALGLASGVLFGVFMGAFASRQAENLSSRSPCAPGEGLLRHGVANHFRRGEGVGGYLWLTEERLLFRSHRYNVQNHDLSIPLREVQEARVRLTAGFVPNGLEVIADGRGERFAVEDRRAWVAGICEAGDRARPTGAL